jgi:hypothetical protein
LIVGAAAVVIAPSVTDFSMFNEAISDVVNAPLST